VYSLSKDDFLASVRAHKTLEEQLFAEIFRRGG
jgi:hypothetical protein